MHCLDDPLEYMREKISLAEALVARSQWPGTTAIIGGDAYGDQERLVVLMVILFLRVGQADRLPSCGCCYSPALAGFV
jgi:hypothetical protein